MAQPSFRSYADDMGTQEFREIFESLLGLCRRERVCLRCSESVWWRCHRRMIADALVGKGFPVEHILAETNRHTHELTPWVEIVEEDGDKQLVYPPGAVHTRS